MIPESEPTFIVFENVLSVPEKVLLSARAVEEAAVMVMLLAPVKSVPFMLAPGESAEAVPALPEIFTFKGEEVEMP